MMFGFPGAVYWAAVAVPVIAIFLYRRRLPVVEVPAVLAWMTLGRPVQPSSFRKLLHRLLSLFAQLLIVALLVWALSDPRQVDRQARRTVIVLDVSATMQTREASSRTRMELAKSTARSVVDQLPSGSEVVLLAAAREPRLVQSLTNNADLLRRAIDGLTAVDVDSDLPTATQVGAGFLNLDQPASLIVVSDFAGCGLQELRDRWRGPGQLRLLPIGSDQPNIAVTALSSESMAAGVQRRTVRAMLSQRGMGGRSVVVHLLVDGHPTLSKSVELSADSEPVVFEVPARPGETYEVWVDGGDALPADDHAYGIVPLLDDLKVCLVSEGNVPLESAIRAGDRVSLSMVRPEAFDGPRGAAVVVVDRCDIRRDAASESVGYLLVGASDPFGRAKVGESFSVGPPTTWADDHPTMRAIDATSYQFRRAIRLRQVSGPDILPLLCSDATPLIAETSQDADSAASVNGNDPVRCVYWLFDLADTDLPSRMGFPVLLQNTLEYLAGRDDPGTHVMLRTGQSLAVPIRSGNTEPRIIDPDNRALRPRRDGRYWRVTNTERQGIYRIADSRQAVAVSLLSMRGVATLPARSDGDAFGMHETAKSSLSSWLRHLDWRTLVLALLVAGVIEWFVFAHGVIRLS